MSIVTQQKDRDMEKGEVCCQGEFSSIKERMPKY